MNTPEFTGERYVPGQGGAQIAYEHLHRYLFALRWAAGKKVLDLASGTGYGAALLSQVAQRVWAVEVDACTVAYAHNTYRGANLQFVQADATRLPLRTTSIDLVVAMEILEHVKDQDGLMQEIARVTRAEGLAIISTPNKAAYSDGRSYSNPFHIRELYRDEFLALLVQHFPYVQLLTQQVRAGSLILAEGASGQGAEIIQQQPTQEDRLITPPMYFIAFCSRKKIEEPPPAASSYLDPTDFLSEEWLKEAARLNQEIESLGRWGRELHEEIGKRDEEIGKRDAQMSKFQEVLAELRKELEERSRWAKSLEEEILRRDEVLGNLRKEFDERTGWAKSLEEELSRRDEALAKLQKEFEERGRWAIALQEQVADRDAKLGKTVQELSETLQKVDQLSGHLARIRRALPYRILCRLGILPK